MRIIINQKKIVRTSFLDSTFLKNLESGLRFGNALLMGTLETLKLKAKVIAEKAAETEKVLMQIAEASQFYTPFALATSKLCFSLENLANVHFLYQFSLKAFLEIVEYITYCSITLITSIRRCITS